MAPTDDIIGRNLGFLITNFLLLLSLLLLLLLLLTVDQEKLQMNQNKLKYKYSLYQQYEANLSQL